MSLRGSGSSFGYGGKTSVISWRLRLRMLWILLGAAWWREMIEDQRQITHLDNFPEKALETDDSQIPIVIPSIRVAKKLSRKKSERFTYLVATVMSNFGITSMAIMAVYYRFYWQMEDGNVPMSKMLGTFALSVGAAHLDFQ
ncbi:hypothetical protein ACFX13_013237 [Malus domestica]|uniref:beta-carotene 3-hydroxylase n=1 Tax=Malus domestica TaxID=3750 RepID=A0A498I478_MALDO|nr:hypothetical protein DVH24_002066 [Malus domestica]